MFIKQNQKIKFSVHLIEHCPTLHKLISFRVTLTEEYPQRGVITQELGIW